MKIWFASAAAAAAVAGMIYGTNVAEAQAPAKGPTFTSSDCQDLDGKYNLACLSQIMAEHAAKGGKPLGCNGLAGMLAAQGVPNANVVAEAVCKAAAPKQKM